MPQEIHYIYNTRARMSIITDLRNLLLPRICPVCGQQMMEGEDVLCAYCAIQMPRVRILNTADNRMTRMLWDTVNVRHAYSYMSYNRFSPYHKLVTGIKYGGFTDRGIYLGRWAALAGQKVGIWEHADALVPVPLSFWRRLERGYNQAEVIARGMSDVCGLPVVNLLKRKRYRTSQTHLNAVQRRENARGTFEAHIPEEWRGKRFMLVDDVMTTGATLANCALALQQADEQAEISVFPLSLDV